MWVLKIFAIWKVSTQIDVLCVFCCCYGLLLVFVRMLAPTVKLNNNNRCFNVLNVARMLLLFFHWQKV